MNFPGRNSYVFGEKFTILVWIFNSAKSDEIYDTILEKRNLTGD